MKSSLLLLPLTAAAELVDAPFLDTKVDYGAFPTWDSQAAIPTHALLRFGPSPSVSQILHIVA